MSRAPSSSRARLTREGLWLGPAGREALWRWRDLSLLLALPVVLAALLALGAARRSPWCAEALAHANLTALGRAAAEGVESSRVALVNLANLRQPADRSQLPTIQLTIAKHSLGIMEASILRGDPARGHDLGGDRPYMPGVYLDETGVPQECDVAYRGLSPHHHEREKPSLRVRVKRRSAAAGGLRYIELTRPEDALGLANLLPSELGRELGLLTELCAPVRVFVNRKYLGVYVRTQRQSEPLAVRQGRLPGVFFKGDVLEYAHVQPLWSDPGAWIATGEEEELAPAREALGRVLAAVDYRRLESTTEDARELERTLDLDRFARWSALLVVTGGIHTDFIHNQNLFWCGYTGRLEPVVWDVNGYGLLARPDVSPDVVRHPIAWRLGCDPRWIHLRNQYLQELIDGVASPAAQRRRLEALMARMRHDLQADPNLSELRLDALEPQPSEATTKRWGPLRRPVAVTEVDERLAATLRWIDARDAFLRQYLAQTRVHVSPDPGRAGWTRVQVAGAVAVHMRVAGGAPTLLHPGLSRQVHASRGLFFRGPAPMVYAFPARPEALTFTNAVTGEPVPPSPSPVQPVETCTLNPFAFAPEPTGEVALGPGEVTLERDLRTTSGQTLVLRAGTTVRLAPNVGIYARGPVRVDGRADAPVRLLPRDEGQAWACLGIIGPATRGTRLSHLRAEGGGEGSDGQARFKGMVSVYGCPDVELTGCWFGPNLRGDDAVNLAQGQVRVVSCAFEGARSDALDLDAVTGTVEGCRFERAGNDGLDLSLSRVLVTACVFVGCGDKGVSVGEGSRLRLRDAQVRGCKYGVQLKDGSAALLEGCALEENSIGVHAYMKKWMYRAGGAGLLLRTRVTRSRLVDVSLDERTGLWLLESQAPRLGHGAERVRQVQRVPAAWAELFEPLAAGRAP